MSKIEIVDSSDDYAIAYWLEARLAGALEAGDGEIAITVPGGSTPFPIFDRLANSQLDWKRIVVWPGDDRIVAESSPASNVGRIRARLEPLGARVVPLTEDAQPPRFALAWLGMGADGHIASLFPSADPRADDALKVRRLTPDPLPPEAPYARISLTIPALLNSDQIVFVIRGNGKPEVFQAAAEGRSDLPVARLLRAATQPVTCFT